MGGMAVLEWPLSTPKGYIRHIIPIATAARHSAWCISWGEAQRQSIYSDPLYLDGYYDVNNGQPKTGLAAARMAALLTYRSRDSFESRFGRKTQLRLRNSEVTASTTTTINGATAVITPPRSPSTPADHALAAHNDGHRGSHSTTASSRRLSSATSPSAATNGSSQSPATPPASSTGSSTPVPQQPIFTAQSYLRYQGDKFTARFDANCYIHISRKMDTHDLSRDRITISSSPSSSTPMPPSTPEEEIEALHVMLSTLPPGALVISIQTDGLFTPSEQHDIANYIPQASLVTVPSPDGHDGFLLEFEVINRHILAFLHEQLPELYAGDPIDTIAQQGDGEGFKVTKTSKFGEAEADITQW